MVSRFTTSVSRNHRCACSTDCYGLSSDFLLRQRSKDRDVIGVLKETQELFTSAANDVNARIYSMERSGMYSAFGAHAGATAPQFNNASHAFRLILYMAGLVKGSAGKLTFQVNVLLDTR